MQEKATSPVSAGDLKATVESTGSRAMPLWQTAHGDLSRLSPADISDLAHFLMILHGRHPGVIDHAATRTIEDSVREWLIAAMEGFATERAFITKLTVVAGPIQGISSGDDSSVAIHNHGRALELLARSDRRGCALGAAMALVIDWWAIRELLNAIAWRMDTDAKDCTLPSAEETGALAQRLVADRMLGRSIAFGSDQLLIQHRGFWDLLAARRQARPYRLTGWDRID